MCYFTSPEFNNKTIKHSQLYEGNYFCKRISSTCFWECGISFLMCSIHLLANQTTLNDKWSHKHTLITKYLFCRHKEFPAVPLVSFCRTNHNHTYLSKYKVSSHTQISLKQLHLLSTIKMHVQMYLFDTLNIQIKINNRPSFFFSNHYFAKCTVFNIINEKYLIWSHNKARWFKRIVHPKKM